MTREPDKAKRWRPKFSVRTLLFLVSVCCVVVWIDPLHWTPAPLCIAATDINIGEKLDAKNVKLEQWPANHIPDGAVRDLDEFDDQYPRTRLYSGEPIVQAKLMTSRKSRIWIGPPKGERIISIKVSIASLESNLVQPGHRVELVAEVPETGARTILHGVKVFSVEGETQRSADTEGGTSNIRTVSLLVNPGQAEAVMLASELGELRVWPSASKPLWMERVAAHLNTLGESHSMFAFLITRPIIALIGYFVWRMMRPRYTVKQ